MNLATVFSPEVLNSLHHFRVESLTLLSIEKGNVSVWFLLACDDWEILAQSRLFWASIVKSLRSLIIFQAFILSLSSTGSSLKTRGGMMRALHPMQS